jgi:hypothetical protein
MHNIIMHASKTPPVNAAKTLIDTELMLKITFGKTKSAVTPPGVAVIYLEFVTSACARQL